MYLKQTGSLKSNNTESKARIKANGAIHPADNEKRRSGTSFGTILSIACVVAVGSILYWATRRNDQ